MQLERRVGGKGTGTKKAYKPTGPAYKDGRGVHCPRCWRPLKVKVSKYFDDRLGREYFVEDCACGWEGPCGMMPDLRRLQPRLNLEWLWEAGDAAAADEACAAFARRLPRIALERMLQRAKRNQQ